MVPAGGFFDGLVNPRRRERVRGTMTLPIFTDDQGRPLPGRPEPLPEGASIADRITWMRARNAYVDAATDRANATFDRSFRAGLG